MYSKSSKHIHHDEYKQKNHNRSCSKSLLDLRTKNNNSNIVNAVSENHSIKSKNLRYFDEEKQNKLAYPYTKIEKYQNEILESPLKTQKSQNNSTSIGNVHDIHKKKSQNTFHPETLRRSTMLYDKESWFE